MMFGIIDKEYDGGIQRYRYFDYKGTEIKEGDIIKHFRGDYLMKVRLFKNGELGYIDAGQAIPFGMMELSMLEVVDYVEESEKEFIS